MTVAGNIRLTERLKRNHITNESEEINFITIQNLSHFYSYEVLTYFLLIRLNTESFMTKTYLMKYHKFYQQTQ